MEFQDYKAGKFSDIADSVFGVSLWKFLKSPEILLRMDTATYLRRPACEAIQDELVREFKEFEDRDKLMRYKQMCGHMVRQIMEQRGYVLDAQRVPLRVGNLFATATRYKKYQNNYSNWTENSTYNIEHKPTERIKSFATAPIDNKYQNDYSNWPKISTYNIEQKSTEKTKSLMKEIESALAERFESKNVKKQTGSTSISFQGRVRAKLIPQYRENSEILLLGVSADIKKQNWREYEFPERAKVGGGNNQPFYFMTLPQNKTAIDHSVNIVRMITENLDIKG
jgi:hypothetical protein